MSKPKPVHLTQYSERGPYDELYTPPEAITPLLYHLTGEPRGRAIKIWEPCDHGGSEITRMIQDQTHHETITSHISDGHDFLTMVPDFHFDMIITNPPYSLKNQFLKKCFEYQKPFALLLPLTALAGIQRGKLYQEHGLDLLVLDRRIDFTGKKAPWFNVAWFTKWILPNWAVLNGLHFATVETRTK